jgi:hypothetical protein
MGAWVCVCICWQLQRAVPAAGWLTRLFLHAARSQGQHVGLEVTPAGSVAVTAMDPAAAAAANGSGAHGVRKPKPLTLAQPAGFAGWAVTEQQFGPGASLAVCVCGAGRGAGVCWGARQVGLATMVGRSNPPAPHTT